MGEIGHSKTGPNFCYFRLVDKPEVTNAARASGLPAQLQRETTSVYREYAVLPVCIALMLMNKNVCRSGKDVVAAGCGVKIIPEEICVWVCSQVSLRRRHDVRQRETGRPRPEALQQDA
jgi:hypothetical protein